MIVKHHVAKSLSLQRQQLEVHMALSRCSNVELASAGPVAQQRCEAPPQQAITDQAQKNTLQGCRLVPWHILVLCRGFHAQNNAPHSMPWAGWQHGGAP